MESSKLLRFVDELGKLLGEDLQRRQWTTLLVYLWNDTMKGCVLEDYDSYDWGYSRQIVNYESCPQHCLPNGELDIRVLGEDTREWLTITAVIAVIT